MHEVLSVLNGLLGLDKNGSSLNLLQMSLRSIIIYVAALIMLQLGNRRILGRNTVFDIILGIILGSVLSRAINGSAAFFPTIGVSFVMVLLHWFFAAVAYRSHSFGRLVKGDAVELFKDGQLIQDRMKKFHFTEPDMKEAARLRGRLPDLDRVKEAWLERNGQVSIVPVRNSEPKIIEVKVLDGVQTVRIQVE